MVKTLKMILTTAILMILMFGGTAGAQDIKSRMLDRLPEIQTLKAKGIVGENNQGLLETRKSNTAAKQIVKAENKDRKAVYQAIAQKTGTTAQVVGKRRAIQIAEKANSGEWLQNASGQWYQKP